MGLPQEVFTTDLNLLANSHWLGDFELTDQLLRAFAKDIMTRTFDCPQHASETIDREARLLARKFLGQDPAYPGPAWNSPGHIDAYLARVCDFSDTDPEERVAHALAEMIARFAKLETMVREQNLIKEQWVWDIDNIIQEYVNLFNGLPREGIEPLDPI